MNPLTLAGLTGHAALLVAAALGVAFLLVVALFWGAMKSGKWLTSWLRRRAAYSVLRERNSRLRHEGAYFANQRKGKVECRESFSDPGNREAFLNGPSPWQTAWQALDSRAHAKDALARAEDAESVRLVGERLRKELAEVRAEELRRLAIAEEEQKKVEEIRRLNFGPTDEVWEGHTHTATWSGNTCLYLRGESARSHPWGWTVLVADGHECAVSPGGDPWVHVYNPDAIGWVPAHESLARKAREVLR